VKTEKWLKEMHPELAKTENCVDKGFPTKREASGVSHKITPEKKRDLNHSRMQGSCETGVGKKKSRWGKGSIKKKLKEPRKGRKGLPESVVRHKMQ